jgi:hypothetical protein
MGFSTINTLTKKACLYSSNLRNFAYGGIVNADTIAQTIENWVCSFDHILSKMQIVAIELQRISVPFIKLIAALLFNTVTRHYPTTHVRLIDPKDNRRYWGITVTKQKFPGLSPSGMYKVRKDLSARTKVVNAVDLRRIHTCFFSRNQFHPDCLDALLIAVYFMFNFEKEYARNRQQSCKVLQEHLERPVETPGRIFDVHGNGCGFVGDVGFFPRVKKAKAS